MVPASTDAGREARGARHMPTLRSLLPCCCLVLAAATTVPADQVRTITSAWRTVDVAVNGDDGEWHAEPTALSASPVEIGVVNDGEFLYLRVRSSDRGAQLQLLFGGLTVWFDPKGGDKKVFGIRYPVGLPLPDPRARARDRNRERLPREPDTYGGRQAPGHARGEPGEDVPTDPKAGPPVPTDLTDVVPRRLEVLGPGKDDVRSLVLDHADGITVSIGRTEDTVVYELRVPLNKTGATPYAIGASPGTTIGLGFESPKMDREKPPDNSTGGSQGGTRGPGGIGIGGFGGGMGGMGRPGGSAGPGEPGGGLPGSAKPWKAWTRVVLAQPPSPAGQ